MKTKFKFLLLLFGLIFFDNKLFAQYCNLANSNVTILPTTASQLSASYNSGRRAFNFTATAGCTYVFETCGYSTADTYLRLYSTGTGGTLLATGDDNCGTQSRIIWTCVTSGTYSILLTNFSCANLTTATRLNYYVSGCSTPFNPCSAITNINSCGTMLNVNINSGNGAYNPPATSCGWQTPGREIIYSFTPTTTGAYSINQTSSFGFIDYFFKPASGGCSGTGWTCIDDLFGTTTSGLFNLTAGIQYYFMLDPETTTGGAVSWSINCPNGPINDNCTGAIAILGLPYTSSITSNTGATDDAPTSASSCGLLGSNLWYTLVGNGNQIRATTCNSSTNFDTEIRVYTGSCSSLNSMVEITCNDDDESCSFSGLYSSVNWCSTVGTTYYISVGYWLSGPGFGNYALSIDNVSSCAPLPIELTSFNTKCISKNEVEITWSTSSETNNDYFTIQKSENLIDYSDVATIDGAGNSTVNLNYKYIDLNYTNGITYYRIKQTDYNGEFDFSSISSITCFVNKEEVSIHPNPSKDLFQISNVFDFREIQLLNTLGEVVFKDKLMGSDYTLNLTGYEKGIYYLLIINNKTTETKKLVLQ
jgi:hypothetical protein